jgi:membrane protein YqaA with SNARE-associated domain
MWGLFAVAVIDSSIIPMPIPGSTDLLLLWLVSHNNSPWLLAPTAILGSILGGYATWNLGRKGGEKALARWVSPRILNRIKGWVERHPALAIFLPAILPPPIPLSPFIVAAGALDVPLKRFLAVFGAARTIRYSFVAWLAVRYGRRIVRLWSTQLDKWSAPLLYTFLALMVVGIAIGIWQFRSRRGSAGAGDKTPSPEAA